MEELNAARGQETRDRFLSRGILICAVVLSLGLQVFLNQELRLRGVADVMLQTEEGQARSLQSYRAAWLGYVSASVDWLLFRILTDDKIHWVRPGQHPRIYHWFDLATRLDPWDPALFAWAGRTLSVIRNDQAGALELLERGVEVFERQVGLLPPGLKTELWDPMAWRLATTLAYVELFELGNLPKAGEAFVRASRYPQAPPYLGRLQESLHTSTGLFEVGLRVVNLQIATEKDLKVRDELLRRRQSLILSRWLAELNDRFVQFRWQGKRMTAATPELLVAFLAAVGVGEADPEGGRLWLRSDGRIESSTPRMTVMGVK